MNFTLASFFVFFTFVALNVIYIPYASLSKGLGFTYSTFTTASVLAYAGLATGSVLFIPSLHKFGRRPIYIISSGIQFVASIWSSQMNSKGEMIAANFISGFGGALSETLLQITIVDLFFVHQHATMSGLFLMTIAVASGFGPLAAGYVVISEDWRWVWRWCAIFLGLNLVLVLFLFEETKYVPSIFGQEAQATTTAGRPGSPFEDRREYRKVSLTI